MPIDSKITTDLSEVTHVTSVPFDTTLKHDKQSFETTLTSVAPAGSTVLLDDSQITRIHSQEVIRITEDVGADSAAELSFYSTAGETINLFRVVYRAADGLVYKVDPSQSSHARNVIGVSVSSAVTGAEVRILTLGEFTHTGWSWTDRASIFCGPDGTLIVTRPTTGYLIRVASSSAPNALRVDTTWAIVLLNS